MVVGIAVWDDPNRKEYLDDRNNYSEDRMITIGMGPKNILFVCWTERVGDTICNIFSPVVKNKFCKSK